MAAGTSQAWALELHRVPALTWDLPAGTKLLLTSPPVQRGVLLLLPGRVQVL